MFAFGTRPEAIKMAPLVNAMLAEKNNFQVQVCVTAQHREMLDQVLRIFDIKPDIDLNLMRSDQDLYDVTTSVLLGMRDVLSENQPDVLLVHGDTTTTLAASIAGFYSNIPIGNIEAGLRTHNISSPFPEEFNRSVVSKISRWHFAPTNKSRENLLAEKVDPKLITVTGNTVIDALNWVLKRIQNDPIRAKQLEEVLNNNLPFDWQNGKFILVTGHRRENFGDGFLQICSAIREISLTKKDIHFVYPVHLNPNVRKPVYEILEGLKNVHLIEPLDYEPFVYLLNHSHIVLTDSGGIQEEAPSLGKPVLVMRDTTERPEAVEAGTVKLVGANQKRIVAGLMRLLDDNSHYTQMSLAHNPYGDGRSCERIINILNKA